jgi:hypothetical protein
MPKEPPMNYELSDVDMAFSRDLSARSLFDIGMDLISSTGQCQFLIEPLAFAASEIDRDNPFVSEIMRTGTEL